MLARNNSRFGFVFKVVVVFPELTVMQNFFFGFFWWNSFCFRISSYSAFPSFVLSIQSVWSILSCFSLMVLLQKMQKETLFWSTIYQFLVEMSYCLFKRELHTFPKSFTFDAIEKEIFMWNIPCWFLFQSVQFNC